MTVLSIFLMGLGICLIALKDKLADIEELGLLFPGSKTFRKVPHSVMNKKDQRSFRKNMAVVLGILFVVVGIGLFFR